MENFKIDIDADGIALITFDVPGKSMNTITGSVIADLAALAERIKSDAAIKGAIIASGKASGFCAGADLVELDLGDVSSETGLAAAYDRAFALNAALRAIETNGKPVAAAIEGVALGGGLEIALACHYRVAADNPKIKLGLPESKVGLIPGGGGTQRLPRIIGVQNAAMMMLQGQEKSPQEAKALGFINELAPAGDTIKAARAWLAGSPNAAAPWDVKGYRVKDGPYTAAGAMIAIGGNAMVSKQTNRNYPAQLNILSCIYEGMQIEIDPALRIESRYFVKTAITPQARGMIRSLFVSMQAMAKGSNRPQGIAPYDVKKVAVIGAGLMGAGIAYVQARAGVETVLIDVALDRAEKGKDYSRKIIEKDVGRGRITKEKGEEMLALIHPTNDYAEIAGADLVIEAVFESPELKAEVTRNAEAVLGKDAIFGSNTSTLPITDLAGASTRPDHFIGIHFFSPVERMNLVEIILGKQTSKETLAKAIDYVLKIRKTPIVVNDHRGFYTSRCFMTYVDEGFAMLLEGYAPAIVENVGRQAGMPMGPLEVFNSVGLDTGLKISRSIAHAEGKNYDEDPMGKVLVWIVEQKDRHGRAKGSGFYEYDAEGKATALWTGLAERVETTIRDCPPDVKTELTHRLLVRQAIEVARCFEEGVITDPRDADVGSILAWGFAPYTGGAVSYIDLFWGVPGFVAEADRLADAYGERFRPNALLRDMAAKGESFYQRFTV